MTGAFNQSEVYNVFTVNTVYYLYSVFVDRSMVCSPKCAFVDSECSSLAYCTNKSAHVLHPTEPVLRYSISSTELNGTEPNRIELYSNWQPD